MGGDGFWVKLKMVVVIWGCWEVGEGLWGVGGAVAAARVAPEAAVVMVEAAAEWVREWRWKMKWVYLIWIFLFENGVKRYGLIEKEMIKWGW